MYKRNNPSQNAKDKGYKPKNSKPGRKASDFDKEQFEKLCEMACTMNEICSWFHCTRPTLESWCKRNYEGKTFSQVYKEYLQVGNCSLRRRQWQSSEKSVPMQIFLGKNRLGQTDNPQNICEEDIEDDAFSMALNNLSSELVSDTEDIEDEEGD